MKKLLLIVVAVALVVAGIFIVPKVTHNCDECGEFFVGAGYKPSIFKDSDVKIICEECAIEQHALEISLGKSLDDFKHDLEIF